MRVGQVGITESTEMIHVWRECGVLSSQRIAVAIDEMISCFKERIEILSFFHRGHREFFEVLTLRGRTSYAWLRRSKRGPQALGEKIQNRGQLVRQIILNVFSSIATSERSGDPDCYRDCDLSAKTTSYRTKNIKLPEMKKLFITLIVLIPFTLLAQPGERLLSDEKREEIESMKVGYLTSKMNLTGEEAQVFWPVYNEYRAEADAHREEGIKKLKEYRENRSDLSEAEVKAYLSSKFEHERAAIAIEENYFNRFLEVLPAEKVARLMEAEEGFKRELLQRVMQERQRARERRR